jgi:hypothetical protein
MSLVCYGDFENTIHIDSERNVVYDFFWLDEHFSNNACVRTRACNKQDVLRYVS